MSSEGTRQLTVREWLALGALGVVVVSWWWPKSSPAPKAESSRLPPIEMPPIERLDVEAVVHTVPLEIGEGDGRSGTFTVWPLSGPAAQARAGDRIEKLFWRPLPLVPIEAPSCLSDCLSRVRFTGGALVRTIALVRNEHIQAAR
jgi:hypothetical protein